MEEKLNFLTTTNPPTNTMDPLYSLPKALIKATVIARPSKKIKSPYLADISIDSKEYLCHSGALGCSGHIGPGATVWVLEKAPSASTTTKSTHEIYLIEEVGTLIGCHPLVANKMAQQYLKTHLSMKDVCAEKKINDCRFDFTAKSDDNPTIIEVKTVPIADYYDGTTKEVQAYLASNAATNASTEKIAIFPYCAIAGKRSVSKEPLSERALKHVQSLTQLVTTYKCMLLFIVQRNDVSKFCITKLDLQYKNACAKALAAGVIIKAISVRWDNQHVYYEKELDIVW
jgi:DNA-binding sugar fermentation-stimulating protein